METRAIASCVGVVAFEDPPALPEWLTAAFPFRRRMAAIGPAHLHFVDEGEGPVVLLAHGNPTWSFLWRKVIARLLPGGVRVVAPDLLGFGLSDKPPRLADHTLDGHVALVSTLFEALGLRDVTIVGQDWGGPIVTRLAAENPERVRALVLANSPVVLPQRFNPSAFHRFAHLPLLSTLVFRGLGFPMQILHRVQGDPASIGRLERRAYRWPLARWRDRAAPLALARLVPDSAVHPSVPFLRVCEGWLRSFKGPTALVWGLQDPILGDSLPRMREALPHALVVETQAGHFLQEEVPVELADAILHVTREAQTQR
jgi:pimeloyl-ACP methyl ester carboxylesterase